MNFVKTLWNSLDGKKTTLGTALTTALVFVDKADTIITNPACQKIFEGITSLLPTSTPYITLSITALGLAHKGFKWFKENFQK